MGLITVAGSPWLPRTPCSRSAEMALEEPHLTVLVEPELWVIHLAESWSRKRRKSERCWPERQMSHGQGTNHSQWRINFRKHWNGEKQCLGENSTYFWSGPFNTQKICKGLFFLLAISQVPTTYAIKEQKALPGKLWKRKLSKRNYQLLKFKEDKKKLKPKGTL